ncbi:hypothetical protein GPLA_1542 [Paraglaciecola polaris LMG 21857]|uniref:Uncharacterized protein n=1 Tax=Paraglaciecola polaris LMG 21857 TaxID=1129793 RepID=K6Z8G6_9ALTE|nr:hypothetical protein GPLA_1542 [Paraglaciecola polaris LMG 21857]
MLYSIIESVNDSATDNGWGNNKTLAPIIYISHSNTYG